MAHALEVSERPHPEHFTRYVEELSKNPRVTAMAEQLTAQGGLLKQAVVLTPVLATEDARFIPSYVEEYARQEDVEFTVVLFPNASLELDPERTAVESAVNRIEALKELHPTLDLRFVVDPEPEAVFSTIGALRKLLWDAAVLASASREFSAEACYHFLGELASEAEGTIPGENGEILIRHETLTRFAAVYSRECVFFNSDVDLVHLQRRYMLRYYGTIAAEYFLAEASPYTSFSSRALHGRVKGLPNLNAVAALYDHQVAATNRGFEASMALPAYSYTKFGGFAPDAHTYEVAGFAVQGKNLHVPSVTLVTDQRRFNHGLHERSMAGLWGEALHGSPEDFSDRDVCRRSEFRDITPERRDELIREKLAQQKPSVFVERAAYCQILRQDEDSISLLNGLSRVDSKREFELLWALWERPYSAAYRRQAKVLGRLLRLGGYSSAEKVLAQALRATAVVMAESKGEFWKRLCERRPELLTTVPGHRGLVTSSSS